jgi:hypothetical protein
MTDVIDMPLLRPLTVVDLADRPDDSDRYPDLPLWAR